MPVFSDSQKAKGKTQYIYDISTDDIDALAQDMLEAADEPFTYVGRINDVTRNLEDIRHVRMTLDNDGQVAAKASIGGSPVTLQLSGTKLIVRPDDSSRDTADMLVGAAYGYDDEGSFDDPFESAMSADGEGGYDGYGDDLPDPRGRSQELTDRYGDNGEYDDYYEDVVIPAPGSDGAAPIKVTEWLFTLIVLLIPVINIVAIVLWLVSKKTAQTKKNFCKASLVLIAFGALMSALLAFTAIQSGLVGALLSGGAGTQGSGTPQVQPYGSTGEGDEGSTSGSDATGDDEGSTGGLSLRGDDDGDAGTLGNAGEEGSSAGESPSVSAQLDDTSAVGELVQSTSGALAIDSATRTQIDGRQVLILTMTARNATDSPAAASALFQIDAQQGTSLLAANLAPTDGFNPDTFNMEIAPGQTATFQVSYVLLDAQDVIIKATTRDGGESVLEATQRLV